MLARRVVRSFLHLQFSLLVPPFSNLFALLDLISQLIFDRPTDSLLIYHSLLASTLVRMAPRAGLHFYQYF
ncbi:hypothetical protein T439DRAFT_200434 [Meredithblackwellia eburnea MCA 4105]